VRCLRRKRDEIDDVLPNPAAPSADGLYSQLAFTMSPSAGSVKDPAHAESAPVRLDAYYAAQTEFKKPLVNSTPKIGQPRLDD